MISVFTDSMSHNQWNLNSQHHEHEGGGVFVLENLSNMQHDVQHFTLSSCLHVVYNWGFVFIWFWYFIIAVLRKSFLEEQCYSLYYFPVNTVYGAHPIISLLTELSIDVITVNNNYVINLHLYRYRWCNNDGNTSLWELRAAFDTVDHSVDIDTLLRSMVWL